MNAKILVVDDNDDFRQLIVDGLADRYQVSAAANGDDALRVASANAPHIVLLDYHMPGLSGLETCRQLREQLPESRVVFISGTDTLEARLAAYDEGADDFISKPCRLAELRRKVEVLDRVVQDAAQLKSSLKFASDAAMQAISSNGEMGGVIDFIKRAHQCRDLEGLLKALLSSLSSRFNRKASAQIRVGNEQKTLNSEGRSSPLEAELLRGLANDRDRIFQFGNRLIINYPHVIVQIKEMPLENPELCGRIRDYAAMMAEAVENRVEGIQIEQRLAEKRNRAQVTLTATRSVLGELEAAYFRQQSASLGLFEQLRSQLENAMFSFGLSDEQEAGLMRVIERTANQATALYDEGYSLDEKFSVILATLEALAAVDETAPAAENPASDESILLF